MLGCGTGEESKMLEEFGASNLTGLDLSENSVKIVNECKGYDLDYYNRYSEIPQFMAFLVKKNCL